MCACGAAWMIGSAEPEAPCQAELPAAGPCGGSERCAAGGRRARQAGRGVAAAPLTVLRTQLCW